MRTVLAPSLKIQALATYDAMSRRAADFIRGGLERRPNLLPCVSAGGTPTRACDLRAARCTPESGLFCHLRVLQMNEWNGLAPANPAACEADSWTKVLEPPGFPRNHHKEFRTDATNPEAEPARIAAWLAAQEPEEAGRAGGRQVHCMLV